MKDRVCMILFALCLVFGIAPVTHAQNSFTVSGVCPRGCDKSQITEVHFAYPEGFQIIARFGYDAGVTIEPGPTNNNAPILTPVFNAYCQAMITNDEAALWKVYSSETVKYFQMEIKREKVKGLLKLLEDDLVSTLCEIRNEQVVGETAVAEIRGDTFPSGIKIVFVRQKGEWKLTNRSPLFSPPSAFSITGKSKFFINKDSKRRVRSELNTILLKVYSLAAYCVDHKIMGDHSEADRFAPLADLRQYLEIGTAVAGK